MLRRDRSVDMSFVHLCVFWHRPLPFLNKGSALVYLNKGSALVYLNKGSALV